MPEMAHPHARKTVGGYTGHFFRRSLHISMLSLPWLYYTALNPKWQNHSFLTLLLICLIIIEGYRLKKGWIFFGQRQWENQSISSFTWSGVAIVLTLIFAPSDLDGSGECFAMPIIAGAALIDPLLGCLYQKPALMRWSLAYLAGLGIWFFYAWVYALPIFWCWIMPALLIACEQKKLSFLDDNFNMMAAPLLILCLYYNLHT
jgi:hypothetical protein